MLASIPLSSQQRAAVETAEALMLAAINDKVRKAFVIEATAGSGKTHTCRAIISHLRGLMPQLKIGYFVFGRSNADEMAAKIKDPAVTVKTFHSAGAGQLYKAVNEGRFIKSDDAKLYDIIRDLRVEFHLGSTVKKLVEQAQNRVLSPDAPDSDFYQIFDHFGLESELVEADSNDSLSTLIDKTIRSAKNVLKASNAAVYKKRQITFSDQIYIPALDTGILSSDDDKFDVVIIDEAQDTSTARRILADKFLKTAGLLIAVGDPYQAIMGFSGADNDALDQVRSHFNAITLPLNVTYRCPKAVVSFVKTLVPDAPIVAADNAPDGAVIAGGMDLVLKNIDSSSGLLCRYNRPLIEIMYMLLSQGIPCQILGKDVAGSLIKLSKKWKSVNTLDELSEKLESWAAKRIFDLTASGKESAADTLNDQVECLQFMINQMPAGSSLDSLRAKIEGMFTNEKGQLKQVATLMSCHKSKGREFPKVFWIGRQKYQPSKLARKAWQKEQERNLIFVAATRAIDTLYDIAV